MIEETIDEVLPKKVEEQYNQFAEVLNDMQTIAPKSPRHSVHGADIMEMVTFSKRGRKGYEIGLTNQGLGDKWSISRGLWFQEYKTDEKNYQWFTNI